MTQRSRFWIAIAGLLVLAGLEWSTLSSETIRVVNGPQGEPLLDVSVRGVALAILLLFGLRIGISYRRAWLAELVTKDRATRRNERE